MRKLISKIVWWIVYMIIAVPLSLGAGYFGVTIAEKIKNLIDPVEDDD